jgi:hypothetical protein
MDKTIGVAWSDVAKEAYESYSKVTHNKNFRGEEMPFFDELPITIQNAWKAAVASAVMCCIGKGWFE